MATLRTRFDEVKPFSLYEPGETLKDSNGVEHTYVRFAEAVTRGDALRITLTHTLASNNAGVINTRSFANSDAPFTVAETDRDGNITVWSDPIPGARLHVHTGTGDSQIAMVRKVVSTSILVVSVFGRSDETWGTTLASSQVKILEPYLASLIDTDDGAFAFIGIANCDASAGDFGWIASDGDVPIKTTSTTSGVILVPGATAGVLDAIANDVVVISKMVCGFLHSAPSGSGEFGWASIKGAKFANSKRRV